jgi:serine/threonine protein kinase
MSLLFLAGLAGQSVNGKYILKKPLGYGGSSIVFLADIISPTQNADSVAIKLIEVDDNEKEKQTRELKVALSLKHKNLIDCYEFFDCDIEGKAILGLVMELADGSLENYLEKLDNPLLSAKERNLIVKSILDGLQYIHCRGIVHSDLKPGNILKVGNVWKLADFGIARILNAKTSTRTANINGTFLFIPPEAVEGIISPAWDIWSLGILLSRLFTDEHPFSAHNEMQIFEKIQKHDPILPQNIDIIYSFMVKGCLHKSREKRWDIDKVYEYFSVIQEKNDKRENLDKFIQKRLVEIEDLKQHDDYQLIIEICDLIIYLSPGCIDAWVDKADAYSCLGQTKESIETYRNALHCFAKLSNKGESFSAFQVLQSVDYFKVNEKTEATESPLPQTLSVNRRSLQNIAKIVGKKSKSFRQFIRRRKNLEGN